MPYLRTAPAGNPHESAALIERLLGFDATWLAGEIWGIDGGLASIKPRSVARLRAEGAKASKKPERVKEAS